ncbi:hypothetical protein CPC08DRAFT_712640, partial [Agrocybe pediades]
MAITSALTLRDPEEQDQIDDFRNELAYYNLLEEEIHGPITKLPPEILGLILERTIPPNFLLDHTAAFCLDSVWKQSMLQKRVLLRICRSWYHVASPLLYEHICILHIPRLQQLLDTLEIPDTKFRFFIKTISFYCLVPSCYAERFEVRLDRLYSLCPNAKSFSYLSRCYLPSSTTLSTLPTTITHLQLGRGVSAAILANVLKTLSPNLAALSFCLPVDNFNAEWDTPLIFPHLGDLSIGLSSPYALDNFVDWDLRRLKKLTLKYQSVKGVLVAGAGGSSYAFFQKHGRRLEFLQFLPSLWLDWKLAIDVGGILELCPELKHLVLHCTTIAPPMHDRVQWIDVWELPPSAANRDRWESVWAGITKEAFPCLRGVRRISSSLVHFPHVATAFPPGEVLTDQDTYTYQFGDLYVRHEVGRIEAVYPEPIEEESESDSDLDYVSSEQGYDTDWASSLEWEMDSESGICEDREAEMDLV